MINLHRSSESCSSEYVRWSKTSKLLLLSSFPFLCKIAITLILRGYRFHIFIYIVDIYNLRRRYNKWIKKGVNSNLHKIDRWTYKRRVNVWTRLKETARRGEKETLVYRSHRVETLFLCMYLHNFASFFHYTPPFVRSKQVSSLLHLTWIFLRNFY